MNFSRLKKELQKASLIFEMDEKWYQRVENLRAGHEYGRSKERRSIGSALDSAERGRRQRSRIVLLCGFLRIDGASNRSMPELIELVCFQFKKFN
jgi:hypothetical protein